MLESLANESIAVNLVNVTVAQVESDDVVVRIALGSQYLYVGIVANVEGRV